MKVVGVGEQKFVEYTIQVPTRIVRFLEAFNVPVQKWLEDAVVDFFVADQDGILELAEKVRNEVEGQSHR